MIPETISHYQIITHLGGGAMGVVYEARDTRLDRTVAIKMLPDHLTWNDEARERFIREAKAASALDHPNICTIYEIDTTEDDQWFIVMAAYDGQTLKKLLEDGPLPVEKALDITRQIGAGLEKAHAEGIIHRDIKPANILITTDGLVKILDFGLAKLEGQSGLTRTGTKMGTAAYMAPEQIQGHAVDQ